MSSDQKNPLMWVCIIGVLTIIAIAAASHWNLRLPKGSLFLMVAASGRSI